MEGINEKHQSPQRIGDIVQERLTQAKTALQHHEMLRTEDFKVIIMALCKDLEVEHGIVATIARLGTHVPVGIPQASIKIGGGTSGKTISLHCNGEKYIFVLS